MSMEVKIVEDPIKRRYVVELGMSQDVLFKNPSNFANTVEYLVAQEIAKRVTEKLLPYLNESIQKAFKE